MENVWCGMRFLTNIAIMKTILDHYETTANSDDVMMDKSKLVAYFLIA